MDYYQSAVVDYLRADRAVFVNTECCIQINPGTNPDTSGPHWYCDAVACDFQNSAVFLCEISYSKSLGALHKRLSEWHQNWLGVCASLHRDCHLSSGWPVRPWLFIPEKSIEKLIGILGEISGVDGELAFQPRITPLEMVQPWKYQSWNRQELGKERPESIPMAMWS